MLNILGLVYRFHMPLRIAGSADAEIAGCLDLSDQLRRIAVILLYLAVLRDIAAQGQHIFNALCL